MNIFFLDNTPEIAAEYHCDKHVVKMIVETAQILSTAHYIHGSHTEDMYKPTHIHHPSTKWAAASISNYIWTYRLFNALLREYTRRYNKVHSSARLLTVLSKLLDIKEYRLTEVPQAMPDEYKDYDPVVAYRRYYREAKKHLLTYKYTKVPLWIS